LLLLFYHISKQKAKERLNLIIQNVKLYL